jgi:hypothetical protein
MILVFAKPPKKLVTVQDVPQAAPASLAEKTRLRLRHSPLRSTATACGLIDSAAE